MSRRTNIKEILKERGFWLSLVATVLLSTFVVLSSVSIDGTSIVERMLLANATEPLVFEISYQGKPYQVERGTSVITFLNSIDETATRGDVVNEKGEVVLEGQGAHSSYFVDNDKVSYMRKLHPGEVLKVIKAEPIVKKELNTNGKIVTPLLAQAIHENRAHKVVALTFDDGPIPSSTPQILKTLKDYNVKATFFVITRYVEGYPDLARAISEQGSQIAIHSTGHQLFTKLTPEQITYDVNVAKESIKRHTGKDARWIRPPYGAVNDSVLATLHGMGLGVVNWNVDTLDWKKPGVEAIVQNACFAAPGAVVLMHDGGGDRSQTVEALGQIIRSYKARGFRFVTIEEYSQLMSGDKP